MVAMQEMDDFFVRNFAGQFVDVVTAIDQLPFFTADIAQARLGGDDSFEAFSHW